MVKSAEVVTPNDSYPYARQYYLDFLSWEASLDPELSAMLLDPHDHIVNELVHMRDLHPREAEWIAQQAKDSVAEEIEDALAEAEEHRTIDSEEKVIVLSRYLGELMLRS